MPVAKWKVGLAAKIATAICASEQSKYATTADSCRCGDHTFRGRVCKHMLAARERESKDATNSRSHQRDVENG